MHEHDTPGSGVDRPTEATSDTTAADHGRSAIEIIRAGVASARDPIVGRVGQARDGVVGTWNERPGARVRRVRRMGNQPLPFLYDVHPEARTARPVEIGLQTIDVDRIAGTAVGGGAQRGGDFLPLKPFRGGNWNTRWQRLRKAQDGMAVLPPIDVVKFADRYWVVDGHNRVGLALYGGQAAIDADVTELVPFGGHRTEPIGSLASSFAASRAVRTAGSGQRPSDALGHEDDVSPGLPDDDR
ncbi:MAG TPA: hypothetical protein VGQ31_02165 [Candidatus Limnocylindrales bacterium]|nr:hypothetical protein [Candidatus Limnocylindrales bacterium]